MVLGFFCGLIASVVLMVKCPFGKGETADRYRAEAPTNTMVFKMQYKWIS